MASSAVLSINRSYVIEDTIGNPNFVHSVDRAITNAAYQVLSAGNPTYLPGFVGTNMYFYTVHNALQALQEHGFNVTFEQWQLRLDAKQQYESPVRLRFAIGRYVGNSIIFNWPKGPATFEGVSQNKNRLRREIRQNQQRLGQRLQLPLLEDASLSKDAAPLNLWVAYYISQKHLQAWLGIGVELVSASQIYCSEAVQVSDRFLDIPDDFDLILVPTESSYPIDFGEKLTGTE